MNNRFFLWLRTVQVHNWHLKLLSLVLSILTFYAIRGATSFEFSFTVPLEVEVAKGIAILDQPATVEVTFRGSQEELRGLDSRQIRAVVKPEISDTASSLRVPVGPAQITGHSGVRVTRIRPEVVAISLDHETDKMFRVLKPRTVGTAAAAKVEIDYAPQSVRISGPRRQLQDREVVETEPVDIGGCVQSFSKRVRVLSPTDTGVTRIDPPEVTVNVNIVSESVTREITNMPVRAVLESGYTNSVSFRPETVTVSLHGSEEAIARTAQDSVKVFVDCVGMDASEVYELPVSVHLPSESDVTATVEPQTVRTFFGTKQP